MQRGPTRPGFVHQRTASKRRHQHLPDNGRARCLVIEHPLHRCDRCGFMLSITRTKPPQQPPRRAARPPPPLIGAAGVGLTSPSSTTTRLSSPRRLPGVRRQGRRRRRIPLGTSTSRGSTTSSARSRVARIRHTPTTRRRVQSLQRSADNAIRGRSIAAVTETRTVTTTYKGNNPRQTSP